MKQAETVPDRGRLPGVGRPGTDEAGQYIGKGGSNFGRGQSCTNSRQIVMGKRAISIDTDRSSYMEMSTLRWTYG